MKKATKKYKILELLAKGHTQGQIVKLLGVNKVTVSRYVKEFTQKKWLKCIDPKAYCKIYRVTPEAPIFNGRKRLTCLPNSRWGRKTTRVHNLCWKFKILEDPRRKIAWDKEIKLKNGVTQKIIYFPTTTIAIYEPSNTIRVWLEEKYTENIDNWDKMANEDMLKTHAFIQKMLLCSLSLPEMSQDEHFAKPIQNPVVMNVLKRQGIMRVGDVWIDASKPGFEFGEIESTDVNKLKIMEKLQWSDENIPNRMNNIEGLMDRVTIHMGRMTEVQQQATVSLEHIENRLKSLEPPISDDIRDPSRPDDFRDVV